MKAPRYFIDTNIIVYCFDKRDPAKQDAARSLVADALESGTGVISYQVVQEFINLATRRFATQIKPDDLQDFLSDVLFFTVGRLSFKRFVSGCAAATSALRLLLL